MVFYTCLLAIWLFVLNFSTISSQFNEVEFYRMELLNSTYVEGLYKVSEFRITKTNRTTYVMNVVWDSLVDFGNDVEMEIKVYHNRYNNNHYNLSPLRVERTSICALTKKFYGLLFTEATRNTTNFIRRDGTCCPYNKGHYYFWKYVFDGTRVPPLFMIGHYKADFFFYYKNITVWEAHLYGKVTSPPIGFRHY